MEIFREDFKRNNINPVKDDLIFQITDWYASDESEDGTGKDAKYLIKIFGVDQIGQSIGVTVENYLPNFFIQIPSLDFEYYPNFSKIRAHIFDAFAWWDIMKIERVSKVNMFGFTNNKEEYFMKLTFRSLKSFKSATFNLKDLQIGPRKYKVKQFESNIEPFLRYMHIQDLEPCGWVKIHKMCYDFNLRGLLPASTNIDLVADCVNISKHSRNKPAPLVVASYDIECTSSHGDFPMAIKTYKKTARELNDFYRSLTTRSKNFVTRIEIEDLLKKQLYGLFEIDGCKESVLTYVIPKSRESIDKDFIKESIDNCVPDIIKLLKDKPQSEKKISDFLKNDLHLVDPKQVIKDMRDKCDLMKKYDKSNIQIEKELLKQLKEVLNKSSQDEDQQQRLGRKAEANFKIILSLFDNDTVFDKVAKKFKMMGFPDLEGDQIIQIGTTFHVYGSTECYFKHIITLKDCDDDFDVDEIVECSTEKQVLKEWSNLIQRMDPDIVTGYNIFGFDNGYIRDRSTELNCAKQVEQLGRLKLIKYDKKHPAFVVKELQSSALGQNILKYYAMEGRVQIDIMKLVQKDHKLDTYKLDHVASQFINGKVKQLVDQSTIVIDNTQGVFVNNFILLDGNKFKIVDMNGSKLTIQNDDNIDLGEVTKWGMVKDDISPNQIFQAQSKGPKERAMIAKYCIQDCALCNYLMMKLEIIANNAGMANVCIVPLSYIFLRGQGVKIFSLVAKQCLEDGFIIPVIRRIEDTDDSYEGAIVLEPKIGIYEEPISVLDFASLYPSSMISENISHDSIVMDEKYDNIPGVDYLDISYDVNGRKNVVRYAQFKEGKKGLLPRILMKLLSQRKLTRKKILYETVETVDNARHSGLITENGDSLSIKDLSLGNESIVKKADIKNRFITHNDFECAVLDGLQLAYKITANSLYGQVGAKTSPIYLQELAASTTATGRDLVMKLKYFAEDNFDCKVVYGDSVMPYTPIALKQNHRVFVEEIQNICTGWSTYPGFLKDGYDKEQAETDHPLYAWTHDGWRKIVRVIRHRCKKKIFRILTHTACVDVTEDHSLLDSNLNLVKPCDAFLGLELFQSFPSIEDKANIEEDSLQAADQITAQKHYVTMKSKFDHISIDVKNGKYIISPFHEIIKDNAIKHITMIHDTWEGFVYDIETEAGTFQAGVGNIVVKNTDSIFLKFNSLKNDDGEELQGKERLQASIDKSIELSKAFKPTLKSPHDAEYEKTFWPFVIMSKKRYVGNLYEEDVNKFKQKSMGIVLKRRDNANILKKVYGGMINIILNDNSIPKAIDFLLTELKTIENGNVELSDLIISKTLKGSYADPTRISHKVLADRMQERDPGSAPNVNDRVPYVYIVNDNKKALQGDRIEHPDFIVKNNVKIDYAYYITNQILKPVSQLLSLRVEQIKGFKYAKNHFDKLLHKFTNELKCPSKAADKVNTMKEEVVSKLIFDPILTGIAKKQKNQTSISDFF